MTDQNDLGPLPEVPDQTPPPGFEPQVDPQGLTAGIYARQSDLIADALAEDVTDEEVAELGAADDDDDDTIDEE